MALYIRLPTLISVASTRNPRIPPARSHATPSPTPASSRSPSDCQGIATPTVVVLQGGRLKVTLQARSGLLLALLLPEPAAPTARTRSNSRTSRFSQNYVLFWDKFERANFFSPTPTATAKTGRTRRPPLLQFLLAMSSPDYAQWDMAVSPVPQARPVPYWVAMPTESSATPPHERIASRSSQVAPPRAALPPSRPAPSEEEILEAGRGRSGRRAAHPRHLLGYSRLLREWSARADAHSSHHRRCAHPREFYERYVDGPHAVRLRVARPARTSQAGHTSHGGPHGQRRGRSPDPLCEHRRADPRDHASVLIGPRRLVRR